MQKRTFRILNLAGEIAGLDPEGGRQDAVLYYKTPDGPRPAPVPSGDYSSAYPVPPDGEIAIFRFEMAPPGTPMEEIMPCCRAAVAAGKPRKVFIIRSSIPADCQRTLVTLSTAPDASVTATLHEDS